MPCKIYSTRPQPDVTTTTAPNPLVMSSGLFLCNLRRVWVPWVVGVRLGWSGQIVSVPLAPKAYAYVHATAIF